ncbi:MAG: class F sortase [Actinomycetota bacterium]|nr:class F sortase [Actinomycetota bacterium]
MSLAIPSIGLRTADFTDLGLERDGSLEVPTDFDDVGWLSSSFAPGQTGPAILAGHVDSRKGPAVFYRLGEVKPGQQVSVTRQDRSVAVFTVERIQRFPKDRFPTAAVYGNTQRAELRLITCGGVFDRKTRHYKDNVVVFAHLTATR